MNEAYDNVEGMGMTQHGVNPAYAQPVIINEARLHDQDNGAFFPGKTLLLSQLVALRCLPVCSIINC